MRSTLIAAALAILASNAAHADPATADALKAANIEISAEQLQAISAAEGDALVTLLGQLVLVAPENAAAIIAASVPLNPELAGPIMSAALAAAPTQSEQIFAATVQAAPEQSGQLAVLLTETQPTAAGPEASTVGVNAPGAPSSANAGTGSVSAASPN